MRNAYPAVAATIGLTIVFAAAFANSATTPESRPIVPAFERFASEKHPNVDLGLLLMTELNCLACHQSTDAVAAAKQAPDLSEVAGRVRIDYLRSFIADPSATKPGATMPGLLHRIPESERDAAVDALVHFLASLRRPSVEDRIVAPDSVREGETLFHQVGCVACHAPQKDEAPALATSVPLAALAKKYSAPSLAAFLLDPLKARPSGRMPSLNLNAQQADRIASFLLRELQVAPNLRYRVYPGDWNSLPDFSHLEAGSSGETAGFDLGVAQRADQFAVVFEGYFHAPAAGSYRFHLGSDDGSKLFLDDRLVVDCDGVHPHQTKSGSVDLTPGPHPIRVEYFEAGGDESLTLEYEAPGIARRRVLEELSLTPSAPVHQTPPSSFAADLKLAVKGKRLFQELGCASCHQLRVGDETVTSMLQSPTLRSLNPATGCLDAGSPAPANYRLNSRQRHVIQARLAANGDGSSHNVVGQMMASFNCFACHARDSVGGVERDRDRYFQTTIQEMGDEGRIPPPLDGVGDKLNADWLRHVFNAGADDRPYMLTRMPKFGVDNVGRLIDEFVKTDLKDEEPEVVFDEPVHRIKSAGRHLVGDRAFSCIKCHNFGGLAATGIQAMDLVKMPQRLRRDWFHRYVQDPSKYRPGTRMPASWAKNGPRLYTVLGGDVDKQIRAVWDFLAAGDQAQPPAGLIRDAIVLSASDGQAVVYRNFIEGAGARAIGVGYPQKLNLAFDANNLRIALLWHGEFIDASKHWVGRGSGFQGPLGDHIVKLADGPPFAQLNSTGEAWPTAGARKLGYEFLGYRRQGEAEPIFRYRFGSIEIVDHPQAVAVPDADPLLRRRLKLTSTQSQPGLWFRAAAGATIEETVDADGRHWYVIDDALKMRLVADAGSSPSVRKIDGRMELLLPVSLENGGLDILQEIVW